MFGVFHNLFKQLAEKARKLRINVRSAAKSADRWCKAHSGSIGYYAAVAALLALLGTASHAYRLAPEERADSGGEAPMAAVALQQAEMTPEPTQEPARWVWPLEGEILGEYAEREPVWSATLMQWQTHAALDIAGSPGEAVMACADGTVKDAWSDRLWGNTIVVEHAEGWQSVYAGLNTLKLVTPGDEVSAGQVISSVGNSSACESEMPWHLHFEVTREGEPVDFRTIVQEQTD
ncbi:MAG: M23 family metallopeptidase [Clostridia bacterium]|nr:M23 family metallopeptidase [Clostridia bacterium]